MSEPRLVTRLRLADLEPGCTLVEGGNVIVHHDPATGTVRAALNRCRHQGGRFGRPGPDCVLHCPRHGWKLDASSMTYVNPVGSLTQEEYDVRPSPDDEGVVELWEVPRPAPWESQPSEVRPLEVGELTVRFWSHACAQITAGGLSLFTDPWLVGPAFTRGWWLAHRPPDSWREELAGADAVYVSHNHSDHLNLPTLRELAALNPDVPVFVPAFDNDSCERLCRSAGLRNVVSAPLLRWLELGPDTRFCILPDASGRDDSALLVDHKGHLVLNTVDCANANDGHLPPHVDVLLTSFAGGATGYPVCWGELYDDEHIARVVERNRREVARIATDAARATTPTWWMPFAGFFVEAHPSDAGIKAVNRKNTPEEVAELVRQASPATDVWVPGSGDVLDAVAGPVSDGGPRAGERTWDDEFARYLPEVAADLDFAPLADLAGVQAYFRWAGFKGDLFLHVVETDETFTTALRELWVDFRDGGTVGEARPDGEARVLRMRVRADVFRHVLRHGMPWEDISIGFQARFWRDPDRYNFDFWDHMQNHLPPEPPPWDEATAGSPGVPQ